MKFINAMIKKGLLNAKELEFRWHKEQDLYDDIAELFNLCTTYDKNLAFISSKHYDDTDEMFNDDFITGLYTPSGPISFHFKIKEMDKFIHLKPYDERGPLYDGYDHDGLMARMDSLILSVLRNDKEDVEKEINNNIYLHESHKPNKCVDSREYGNNNTIKKTR